MIPLNLCDEKNAHKFHKIFFHLAIFKLKKKIYISFNETFNHWNRFENEFIH